MAARVDQVQRVQFNWLNFLWENLAQIRKQQRDGNVVEALTQLTSLVSFCPKAIKDQFQQRANAIDDQLAQLMSTARGSSLLDRHLRRNRRATHFALLQFPQFIREFTSALDAAGYMEKRSHVPEGMSHTRPEAYRRQQKRRP